MGSCLSKKHALSNEETGKFIALRQQIHMHICPVLSLTPQPHHAISVLDGIVNRTPGSNQQSDLRRPTNTEFDPYHQQFQKDPISRLTG